MNYCRKSEDVQTSNPPTVPPPPSSKIVKKSQPTATITKQSQHPLGPVDSLADILPFNFSKDSPKKKKPLKKKVGGIKKGAGNKITTTANFSATNGAKSSLTTLPGKNEIKECSLTAELFGDLHC